MWVISDDWKREGSGLTEHFHSRWFISRQPLCNPRTPSHNMLNVPFISAHPVRIISIDKCTIYISILRNSVKYAYNIQLNCYSLESMGLKKRKWLCWTAILCNRCDQVFISYWLLTWPCRQLIESRVHSESNVNGICIFIRLIISPVISTI